MTRQSFLDTIWARLIAGLVALAAAGVLAYLSRDAIWTTAGTDPEGSPTACLEEQLGHIDKLVAEGAVKSGQVAEMRIRARQFCESPSAAE